MRLIRLARRPVCRFLEDACAIVVVGVVVGVAASRRDVVREGGPGRPVLERVRRHLFAESLRLLDSVSPVLCEARSHSPQVVLELGLERVVDGLGLLGRVRQDAPFEPVVELVG